MEKSDQVTTSRSRGRPTLPESERKRARNLSVSDPAWERLEERLKTFQIKTASELLEKIGQGQIQLVGMDTSPLADVPIYRRLKSLIGEPVAVFWSILAFVERICRQFDLEPTDDKVYTVTMKACVIAFYIGYTHPDVLINNPSALLRWLCYRILQAEVAQEKVAQEKVAQEKVAQEKVAQEKVAQEKVVQEKTGSDSQVAQSQADPQQIERHLWKIGNAFHALEMAARSPDYEALKMKLIDGLTIKQISRVFKLQNLEVSKAEVSTMIKRGLANFRQLLYGDSANDTPQIQNGVEKHQAVWEEARCYITLALQETLLDSKSQRVMETILLKTSQDPYLDFWLNEIDYDLGSQKAEVRDRIAETLENHLVKKKAEIDRKLTFCRTREQMRQILHTYACKEAGTNLPSTLLLSETARELDL